MILRNILDYYGLSYESIYASGGSISHACYGEHADLFADNQVDIFFGNIAAPWEAVKQANETRDVIILPLPDDLLDYLVEEKEFYYGVIEPDMYDMVNEPLKTASSRTVLAAHAKVPDETAYKITGAILENPERVRNIHQTTNVFKPEEALVNLGAPLHPGAERYYKENGYL